MGWNVKNIFHALLFMLFIISIETADEVKPKFIPSAYDIFIETQKEHFEKAESKELKFAGTVKINFKKEPPTGNSEFKILLNTNPKTTLKKVTLTAKSGTSVKVEGKVEGNKLVLTCPKEANGVEGYELIVEYENPFGDDMTGFYRSSYMDSNNITRWLLTTHFEPIFARNAFPCFDEPHLKAKFKVSIKVPKEITTVLSNTEQEGKAQEDGGFKTFKFKETDIPMSTYLVAFTASNFKSTAKTEFVSPYQPKQNPKNNLQTEEKKTLLTYGREDIIQSNGQFAQEVGKAAIEELTKYLELGYALKKVDQVGIPDFSAGAMENFGHISFREKSLFYNSSSTTMTKQSNLLTIVHELVHQWFGNLVTLESWDYIWLNEAFATYLEYVIASKIQGNIKSSDWNLMHQMVVNEIHSRAFETDGLTSSKPLTNKITDENLIFSAFNDIPYSKGAAVLRMWDFSFEKGKFQESLKKYIKDRREDTANPGQLFNSLKSVMKMNDICFKSWTEQKGYPVVQVQKINDSCTLKQSPFTWEKSGDEKTVWSIPITYITNQKIEGKTEPQLWLEDNQVKTIENVKGSWIIVNYKQAGYYRVNYNAENWVALSKALTETDHSKIPVLNRAQIINDIFSLARSVQKEYVNYSLAFDLTKYLVNETNFIPLKTALNSFDFLLPKLPNEKTLANFKSYVLKIIEPHFKNLSSKVEGHVEKLKNVEISRWACSLDYEPCVKDAKSLYQSKKDQDNPDIQEIVLCTIVRTDKAVWAEIFKKYKEEKDSTLRVMYLTALGCTSNSSKAEEFLKKTLESNSDIRKQDLMFVLSAVYNGNSKNLDTAFSFVEKNFTDIAKTYGGINPLGRAIVGIARKLNTDDQCKRLEKLVENVKKSSEVKGANESLEDALKIAKANCEWNKQKMSQLDKYFSGSSSLASSLSLLLLCLLFIFRF